MPFFPLTTGVEQKKSDYWEKLQDDYDSGNEDDYAISSEEENDGERVSSDVHSSQHSSGSSQTESEVSLPSTTARVSFLMFHYWKT